MERWNELWTSFRSIFIAILILVCFIDFMYKKIFLIKYAKKQAVLPYIPIIGSIFLPLETNFDIMLVLQLWIDRMKRPFYLWFFIRPYYLTIDPDELKIILTSPHCLEKGYAYKYVDAFVRNCILTIKVPEWKKHRKIVSKCFSQKQLDNFVPLFNIIMDKQFDQFEEERIVDNMVEKCERMFLTNFLETICDFNFETTTIDLTDFYEFDLYEAIKSVTHAMLQRIMNPLIYPSFIYNNISMGRRANKLSQYLENSIISSLHEKRDQQKNNTDFMKKDQFLETLIKEYKFENDMVQEVKLFGAGASETSGTGLAAALNILGIYPDIQEKVYQEVVEVIGNHGHVDYTHLLNLKYTEMVILETLRLFPPVPMVVRKATVDIDLGDGKILPSNTDILIPFIALHRCEKYWDKPSEFRPERFAPENLAKRHSYAFLPFSAGPRNCIGNKYSIMTLKTALAKAVLRFKIKSRMRSIDDIKTNSFILLSITSDMTCEFIPRKYKK